jgi:hypothetical protein
VGRVQAEVVARRSHPPPLLNMSARSVVSFGRERVLTKSRRADTHRAVAEQLVSWYAGEMARAEAS